MGGIVTVVARYKNGETVSFKANTSFVDSNFNHPHVLEENWLKSQIESFDLLRDNNEADSSFNVYNSRKAINAPYDYGIILIDYINKTILSGNDYNAFLLSGMSPLLYDLMYCYPEKIDYFSKEDGTNEEYLQRFKNIPLILYSLKHNIPIKKSGVVIEHDGTLDNLLEKLFDIKLNNKSESKKQIIMKLFIGENYQSLEDYANIEIDFPHWTIKNLHAKNAQTVFNYIKGNSFNLTQFENEVWLDYIESQKSREENE